jgi:hypothetical protein
LINAWFTTPLSALFEGLDRNNPAYWKAEAHDSDIDAQLRRIDAVGVTLSRLSWAFRKFFAESLENRSKLHGKRAIPAHVLTCLETQVGANGHVNVTDFCLRRRLKKILRGRDPDPRSPCASERMNLFGLVGCGGLDVRVFLVSGPVRFGLARCWIPVGLRLPKSSPPALREGTRVSEKTPQKKAL